MSLKLCKFESTLFAEQWRWTIEGVPFDSPNVNSQWFGLMPCGQWSDDFYHRGHGPAQECEHFHKLPQACVERKGRGRVASPTHPLRTRRRGGGWGSRPPLPPSLPPRPNLSLTVPPITRPPPSQPVPHPPLSLPPSGPVWPPVNRRLEPRLIPWWKR